MTITQDRDPSSPWVSIWLSPRRTIDHILATQPRHLVWLLAALGAVASFYGQFLSVGFLDQLLGWRGWLCFIMGSAALGILFLYLNALILRGTGSLIGGRATSLELRAALAWSAIPAIAGVVIALSLNAAANVFGGAGMMSPAVVSVLSQIVVAVSGLWSFVIMLLMFSRIQDFGFWRTIAAYAAILILPVLLALLVRTFLFQPFSLPSGSMQPTLLVGDNIFASKYAYGYTRYSFPFSPPLFSGRILGSAPARGDVAVFRLPKDVTTDYVKRVVGLPGDRIQMREGQLYINDVAVKREPLADFVGDACGNAAGPVKRWRETLPNGATYETLDCVPQGFYDNTSVYTVPSGHFFMLGDNRDNSTDSRVISAVGYIPLENMIGRVEMVYFSRAPGQGGARPTVRAERTGLVIR